MKKTNKISKFWSDFRKCFFGRLRHRACARARTQQTCSTWAFGVESLSGRSLRHGHREPHFAARLVASVFVVRGPQNRSRSVTSSGSKKGPFGGVLLLVLTNGQGGAPRLVNGHGHASCHPVTAMCAMPSHVGHQMRGPKAPCDASLAVVIWIFQKNCQARCAGQGALVLDGDFFAPAGKRG